MTALKSVKAIIAASEEKGFNVTTELSKPAVTKELIVGFAQYLFTELKGRDTAINKLTEQFERINDNLINQKVDAIVEQNTKSMKQDVEILVGPITESIKSLTTAMEKNIGANSNTPLSEPTVNTITTTDVGTINIEPYEECSEEFLEADDEKQLLELFNNIDYDKVGDQREVHYFGEYGYRYTGGDHKREKIPKEIEKFIEQVDSKYNCGTDCSALVSKYSNGDNYCPPHSDNERGIAPWSDIYTFSVGADREMEFTAIINGVKRTIILKNNSLLRFSRKSQAYWKHSILADPDITAPRFSLTLRFNRPHNINSTVIYGDSNTKYFKFGSGEGTFGAWMPGTRIKTQRIRDIPSVDNIPPYHNIVIHTGVNDVNRTDSQPATVLVNELEQKCRSIHSVYPNSNIFISPLLPTKETNLNQKIWKVNEGIVNLCKKHHNVLLIDNSIFAGRDDCLLPEYGCYHNPNDTVHLGRTGVKLFASSIKSYILRKNVKIGRSLNYHGAYNNDNRYQ